MQALSRTAGILWNRTASSWNSEWLSVVKREGHHHLYGGHGSRQLLLKPDANSWFLRTLCALGFRAAAPVLRLVCGLRRPLERWPSANHCALGTQCECPFQRFARTAVKYRRCNQCLCARGRRNNSSDVSTDELVSKRV